MFVAGNINIPPTVLLAALEWGVGEFLTLVVILLGILGSGVTLVWKASAANTKLEGLSEQFAASSEKQDAEHNRLWTVSNEHAARLNNHEVRIGRAETRIENLECDE